MKHVYPQTFAQSPKVSDPEIEEESRALEEAQAQRLRKQFQDDDEVIDDLSHDGNREYFEEIVARIADEGCGG